jgi:poly-gamma-glutamate synthesis protein (capsule biosynthesis protein)
MRSLFFLTLLLVAGVVWQQGLFLSTPAMLQFLGLTPLEETQSVWFVGDVFLGRDVAEKMQQADYGPTYPFLGDIFPESPFIVGNFESAAPDVYRPTEHYTFRFNVRQAYLHLLHTYGYQVISLANNHSFDAGVSGYEETVAAAELAGLTPIGPVPAAPYTVIERNGVSIAIVPVGLVIRAYEPAVTLPLVQAAAEAADVVVVYVHWGDEYELTHNLFQEQVATDLAAAGADVVIGHHPHVVQDVHYIGDTLVFYSLGNFIFDQYFSTETQQGLVLELTPTETTLTWSLVPVTSEGTYIQPNRMTEPARTDFLTALAKRSSAAVQESVLLGQLIQPR